MINIIQGHRVKDLDQAYMSTMGISSWQLMESAVDTFTKWFINRLNGLKSSIFIFCGPGNNGGDGLGVARKLSENGFDVSVIFFVAKEDSSPDNQLNFSKLPPDVKRIHYSDFGYEIKSEDIIIDALFGVGISRPLSNAYKETVNRLNFISATKISIDIPSGLTSEGYSIGLTFKADYTVSFQFPKLALLLPENAAFTGVIEILDIGIPSSFMQPFGTKKYFLERSDICSLHKKSNVFSHKGDYGKILLIGGSLGKVGAILLSARAALRTGSGLVNVSLPEQDKLSLNIYLPEAMYWSDSLDQKICEFDAIGIGPGWGVNGNENKLKKVLDLCQKPVVLDADALNILAKKKDLISKVPKGSILTPHLKEFDRLFGESAGNLERFDKALNFTSKYGVYLILKGAFTSVFTPEGDHYFNSTGNPHMATAGSGDVLTGMLTSLLGQGYISLNAALVGVYHHGLAGDIASIKKRRSTIASDIIEGIADTFIELDIS